MTGENLDRLCAQSGYQMACDTHKAVGKNAENLITKSLAVLQESGIYAFFLYLKSRGKTESKGAEQLTDSAVQLFKKIPIRPFDNLEDPLEAVRGGGEHKGLGESLDDYLLAKSLLQQALIYARYHAKALP